MEEARQNVNSNRIDSYLTSGVHNSYWLETLPTLEYAPLQTHEETDVVIVGGGIAGITIAYRLSQLGYKVVVVEDGSIGSGETGRTTAHLVAALDDRYMELARIFGKDTTREIVASHNAAIDFIEATIRELLLDCEFKRVPGYLFQYEIEQTDIIQQEFIAAKDAGLTVSLCDTVPGLKMPTGPGILFEEQARFHPMKYLHGLCAAVINMGGRIYTGTHAAEIDSNGIITAEGHAVKAKHVVIATNTPVNNKYTIHLKQFAYRTYVIASPVPKGSVPDALWWDTGDKKANSDIPPYHYVRLQPYNEQYDLLICGGEDHATGLAFAQQVAEEDRYALLERWMRARFNTGEIVFKWSGQVMEPMDSLAYIGRNPGDKENVYIVTGDSGNGMTHATIAGLMIPEMIMGNKPRWESIYDPARAKIFKSGKTWLKEFAGGFFEYLREYPRDAEKISLSSIPVGEGRIVALNGKKYGIYKDEHHMLHVVEASCTHLQCIVKWNNDEKSWDCPCHGSRFTYEGKVINGPANQALQYFREPEPAIK
ncbi:FAD-dependent oxidoreductase [Chitinophaga pendula]|uniref:FAD-dependent oxidoreductase n=1 Tax=Chitinophaga TaxID=79328 RepID=UPI000BAF4288|nr:MULTISPECIES: FAD-dependent oxidoreductase [Chitinophaga]ASZ10343.1 (2Fe-2S)-binding protein [Chitinophaga sp. MD30]UCJ06694.1 FAD-dependent oxidoreductase [Chitinophaga pendula]